MSEPTASRSAAAAPGPGACRSAQAALTVSGERRAKPARTGSAAPSSIAVTGRCLAADHHARPARPAAPAGQCAAHGARVSSAYSELPWPNSPCA